ncbi:hypothetical protein ACFWJW_01100 [Streptomyces sp. NPDC127097]|uniref:hypothetical protein n=1 Tax=Streptomyces sp. NPDC127097 TaxID=3347136 RepID=UPI003661E769
MEPINGGASRARCERSEGALGAAAFHAVGWEDTALLGLAAMLGAASITLYATRKAVAEHRLLHLEKAA